MLGLFVRLIKGAPFSLRERNASASLTKHWLSTDVFDSAMFVLGLFVRLIVSGPVRACSVEMAEFGHAPRVRVRGAPDQRVQRHQRGAAVPHRRQREFLAFLGGGEGKTEKLYNTNRVMDVVDLAATFFVAVVVVLATGASLCVGAGSREEEEEEEEEVVCCSAVSLAFFVCAREVVFFHCCEKERKHALCFLCSPAVARLGLFSLG